VINTQATSQRSNNPKPNYLRLAAFITASDCSSSARTFGSNKLERRRVVPILTLNLEMARNLFVLGAIFVGMCMLVAASAAGEYVRSENTAQTAKNVTTTIC
jgi:hypothetical protein